MGFTLLWNYIQIWQYCVTGGIVSSSYSSKSKWFHEKCRVLFCWNFFLPNARFELQTSRTSCRCATARPRCTLPSLYNVCLLEIFTYKLSAWLRFYIRIISVLKITFEVLIFQFWKMANLQSWEKKLLKLSFCIFWSSGVSPIKL